MKIKKSVREKYMELCPYSTRKCDTYEEIDYKIKRAVEIGRLMNTYPYQTVQYYYMQFTIKDNTIIDMKKTSDYFYITSRAKRKYDEEHFKISVCEGDYNNDKASNEEIYELLFA